MNEPDSPVTKSLGERLKRYARHPLVLGVVAILALAWATTYLSLFQVPRVEAPRPEIVDDEDWMPPLPPSTLAVPVVADLGSVLRDLEGVVPRRHGSLEDRRSVPDNARLDVAFELRRSPFDAGLRGRVAHLSSVISYRGRVWYDPPVLPTVSASCATGDGEPAPRAIVELAAHLRITSDWQLRSRPRIVRVAPVTETDRDRCRLTVLNFDVTGRVMDGARSLIEDRIPDIRRALAGVDLRSRFQQWWDILSTPIELDQDVWLLLNPEAVAQGETLGSGTVLTAQTVLTARPRLVLGPRPESDRLPLPALDTARAATGLTIRATAEADYATASARLNEQLAGQTLEQSGHTVQIERLELSGIGGRRVALEVELSGAAKGRVFLVGSPEFDDVQGQAFVPDLEFDVATANLLVGGLDWLAHEELAEFLRERARWPADDLTEMAAEQLTKGLNSTIAPGVRLEGRVDAVRILGVHPTRAALVVHAAADATATLIVEDR